MQLEQSVEREAFLHETGNLPKRQVGPIMDHAINSLVHLLLCGGLLEPNRAEHVLDVINIWQFLVEDLHLLEVLLDFQESHVLIVLRKIKLQLVKYFFVFFFVLAVVQRLVDLVELFQVLLNHVHVIRLKVLSLNQFFELSDELAHEDESHELEHKKNQNEGQGKVRSDIFHIVVEAKLLVLCHHLSHIQLQRQLNVINMRVSGLHSAQLEVGAQELNMQFLLFADIYIASRKLIHNLFNVQSDGFYLDFFLAKRLRFSKLQNHIIFINKFIYFCSLVRALARKIFLGSKKDRLGDLGKFQLFVILNQHDEVLVGVIKL